MISFQWFFVAVRRFVPLRFASFSRMFSSVVVGRPLFQGPSGFQSRSERWQAGCLVLPEQLREMTGWLSGASRAGQRDGRLVAWCFQSSSER